MLAGRETTPILDLDLPVGSEQRKLSQHPPVDGNDSIQALAVHALVLCPPLARGTCYLLVARTSSGPVVLKRGITRFHSPVHNLARVRQMAARIEAGEVHIVK